MTPQKDPMAVHWHVYVDTRLSDLQTRLDERWALHLSAMDRESRALDSRFNSVNEFRGQLSDQARNFVTRRETDAALAAIVARLDGLSSRVDKATGAQDGISAKTAQLLTLASVVIAAIGIALAFYLGTRNR